MRLSVALGVLLVLPADDHLANASKWPFSAPTTTAARKFLSDKIPNGWLRSVPALSTGRSQDHVAEVAVKTKRSLPRLDDPRIYKEFVKTGTYYGLAPSTLKKATSRNGDHKPRVNVKDTVSQTLAELRSMRLEMEALRKELYEIRRSAFGLPEAEPDGEEAVLARKKRVKEYDRISKDVEKWADRLLFRNNDNEWTEVKCNKVMRHLNAGERTKAYLTWMKDSRGSHANPDDDREYPCLKIFSTIDAPIDQVCMYLAQEQKIGQYNDLVVNHGDIEELSPDSKICFGRTPKILIIKPREFITFCRHRWKRDGSQVMVNQACHENSVRPNKSGEDPGLPRAFALRGAHFISRDPNDPEKTAVALIAHGNPGLDIPEWAIKTAVKAVAPIEPFKLFHKINKGVCKSQVELTQRIGEIEMASTPPSGRSPRPAGMAQLGFACFWPSGGGLQEGSSDNSGTLDTGNDGLSTTPNLGDNDTFVEG